MISILEKDIQRTICEYLSVKKYFFWRSNNIPVFSTNNAGKRTFRSLPKFTPRGLPDIIVIYKGQFIALEIKRPKAKLRPEQADFGSKCIENGGKYFILHSLEELQELEKNNWKK